MKRFSIILLLILMDLAALNAQNLLTNDNSLVAIDANVPFTIQGSVMNSGTILNEGALRLLGDWDNSGDYNSVSGTFSLLGENQIFTPGDSEYAHLAINSTGVAVTSGLVITKSLELINGIVSLTSDATLLLNNEASITGGNSSSYIDGALFISPRESFNFPVGSETEYLPVTLSSIESEDSIGVQAFGSEIESTISSELDSFSPNRHWVLMGNDGFSVESISLPIKNETFIETEDEAVVAFTADLNDPLKIMGVPLVSGNLSEGIITSSGRIIAGYYVLADQSVGGPPITVINVVTSLQDGKHDFLRIENIEFYENNLVEIYDRQGVKVFKMTGYNNQDRVFRGKANVGSRGMLETGSYYFTIQLTGSKREAGFVYVKN